MIDYRENNIWTVYIHIFPNNKYYVGITSKETKSRWGNNGNNYQHQKRLYNAIQKYGWDNIQHEIIAEHLTESEAKDFEISLISKLKSNDRQYGYNITSGGDGVLGIKHIGKENGMYGKHHSEETLKKISNARKGKLKGKDHPMYGKHFTEEAKQKIREARTGQVQSKETIKKRVEKNNKKVAQIDIETNKIIKIYNSIKEAAEELNLDRGSISKCCHGLRKTVGGYKWEFV